ncbi:transposase [Oceanisphaera sp. DM8]|uniref:Transposase n=1 Tax=Oceanisphaera pacifica TaxID=2818389 RepID=A0ABS3NIM4_9GAMM|nr:transposase [Oceanisphaera pacifica]
MWLVRCGHSEAYVKTSQTCPDCGVKKKKTLAERWHSCPCCCEKHRNVASAQVNLN